MPKVISLERRDTLIDPGPIPEPPIRYFPPPIDINNPQVPNPKRKLTKEERQAEKLREKQIQKYQRSLIHERQRIIRMARRERNKIVNENQFPHPRKRRRGSISPILRFPPGGKFEYNKDSPTNANNPSYSPPQGGSGNDAVSQSGTIPSSWLIIGAIGLVVFLVFRN